MVKNGNQDYDQGDDKNASRTTEIVKGIRQKPTLFMHIGDYANDEGDIPERDPDGNGG